MSEVVLLQQSVMADNEKYALLIKKNLKEKGILFVNIIGSPGCGKTTLLEETAKHGKFHMAVIEGDIETSRDAERLAALGVSSYQINTHGGCHLEAHVIERIIEEIPLENVDVLFVENIGNLVCPAEFDLGEDFKTAVLSTPEGADKPLKYPMLFANSLAIVLSKMDLLPYVRFDMHMFKKDISSINPVAPVFEIDLINGGGINEWLEFISQKIEEKKRIK